MNRRNRNLRQYLVAGLLLAPVLCPAAPAEKKQIGFVLEVEGDWLIDDQPIRDAGQGVPAKGVIRLAPQVDFRLVKKLSVTVILLNNKPMHQGCNSFATCKDMQPLALPASLAPPSTAVERALLAVKHLLSLDAERYLPASSRGAGGPHELHDAVLLLKQDRLSIAEWFHDVEPGSYSLTFVFIGRNGRSRAPVNVYVDWKGADTATVAARNMEPGLYVVRAVSASNLPIAKDPWVLLSSDADFNQRKTAYLDNVATTRSWDGVDPGTVQTFLRASLDQLAVPVSDNEKGK